MATPDHLVELLISQINTKESPPKSNCNPYSRALHRPCEPWCADLVVWACRQLGISLPSDSASTPVMCNAFHKAGKLLTTPSRGALAFFDFPEESPRIDHVGCVEAWSSISVTTIDGNTSEKGSQSNGGEVLRRTRSRSLVVGYGQLTFVPTVGEASHMLNKPACRVLMTPSGHGYYIVAQDGGVFAYGDAHDGGQFSVAGQHHNAAIIDAVLTTSGNGMLLLAADGGLDARGDAEFHGSAV